MDFQLNDDRRMLDETLRRFLDDNYDLEKRHGFAMSEDRFSKAMWQQFSELGIIGALFPVEAGGYGGEGPDLMVVFENLGRSLVVEPFLPTLLAGSVLCEAGDHSELLENVISGQAFLALAHGEPEARYELSHVTTSAHQVNGEWKISGDKAVVLGGGSATQLVVSARVSGDSNDEQGIGLFLVKEADRSSVREYGTLDGYAAAEVKFEETPAVQIVDGSKGFELLEKAFDAGIVAVSSQALGAMEIAKDLTVEYMKQRMQFGVQIGKFQALQHRMADILIELEQMRSAIINAAGNLHSDKVKRGREVSACKYLLGKIGRQVAEESIQIHGGMGMTWEYAVGHYAKHIIMTDHLFGDMDHHLERYISLSKNT